MRGKKKGGQGELHNALQKLMLGQKQTTRREKREEKRGKEKSKVEEDYWVNFFPRRAQKKATGRRAIPRGPYADAKNEKRGKFQKGYGTNRIRRARVILKKERPGQRPEKVEH